MIGELLTRFKATREKLEMGVVNMRIDSRAATLVHAFYQKGLSEKWINGEIDRMDATDPLLQRFEPGELRRRYERESLRYATRWAQEMSRGS